LPSAESVDVGSALIDDDDNDIEKDGLEVALPAESAVAEGAFARPAVPDVSLPAESPAGLEPEAICAASSVSPVVLGELLPETSGTVVGSMLGSAVDTAELAPELQVQMKPAGEPDWCWIRDSKSRKISSTFGGGRGHMAATHPKGGFASE
jgi:hypothetical protein